MYQIKELADLSGITTRTLRYYDSINLLKPKQVSDAGHRLYGAEEAKRLQQILFLKELDFSLKETKELLDASKDDYLTFFTNQHQALLDKKDHLENIINLIEKTIQHEKGMIHMTDSEKFKAFKEQQLKENREKYEDELIKTYGQDSLEKSEAKYRELTEQELNYDMKETEEKMLSLLEKDVLIPSETANLIYQLHNKWLNYSLDLTPEIHRSLADMYLADERFTAYYDDKVKKGTTQILRDIIYFYGK